MTAVPSEKATPSGSGATAPVLRRRGTIGRQIWLGVAGIILAGLVVLASGALDFLSPPNLSLRYKGPLEAPPFGTDRMGISLVEYAQQGAAIVTFPALVAGLVVMVLAMVAGLTRCANIGWTDTALQAFSELVGALPRMVVVLVVALAVPREHRSLYPIAVTWALLAAPGAMDEAAATAERLGGARFVEALRAHGFSAFRIYVLHILAFNLRSVIVRQGAEVAMQAVFLEIALSYLAESQFQPSFTHSDSTKSWASLLYDGYTAIVAAVPMQHALGLGLGLVAIVAVMAQAIRLSARPR
jgi:ABC-type dipeptide/oligopeptide/nickel transport system permease subunit